MPERLRVVQVLEAALGGSRKHVLDLCTRLDPARFELHAVVSPLRDPNPDETREVLEQAGVPAHCVPMRRQPDPCSDARCLAQIRQVLRAVRPQVVHCHSSKAGALGRLAAWLEGGVATVYTAHGFAFGMRVNPVARALYTQVERALGRRTDRLVALCASERELALRAGLTTPERCVVIENGLAPASPASVDRAALLRSVGLGEDSRVVLCVGDLREQKGHRYAIEALGRLAQRDPRLWLVILGEGTLRSKLEQLAARVAPGRVRLAGTRDDVAHWLACCEVFCQPSLWEGCPYALLEAAQAGCGLVAAEVCGNQDVVEGGAGWLVPAGDSELLAGALWEALGDAEERARRGALARARVDERYTLERMARLTAELYVEVSRSGRR